MSYLMKAVTRITLDLSMPDVQKSITCTRGDRLRLMEIIVTNEGKPFQLPPRWSALLTGTKPDGKDLTNGCVVENGRIVYDFEAGYEIATCLGRYAVTVWIYDEDGVEVAAPKIWVNVIESGAQQIVESKDQFNVLVQQEVEIFALQEKDKTVDAEISGLKAKDAQVDGILEELKQKTDNLIQYQQFTMRQSAWTDENPFTTEFFLKDVTRGSVVFLIPATDETRRKASKARLTAEVQFTEAEDGYSSVLIARSEASEPPDADLIFFVIIIRKKVDATPIVALLGLDTTAADSDEEISGLKAKDAQVDEELETLRSKLKNVVSSKVITIDPSQWTDVSPHEAAISIGVPGGTERRSTVLLIPKNKETRDESQAIELTAQGLWTADQAATIMIIMTRQDTDPPTIPLSYLALVVYDEEAADDSTATAEFVGVVNLPDALMEREVKRALAALGVTEDLITTMGDVDAVRRDVEQAKEEIDQAKEEIDQAKEDIDQAKTDIEKMVSVESVTVSKTKWTGTKSAQVVLNGATDPDTVFFFFPADEPTKTAATKARMTMRTFVGAMPSIGYLSVFLEVENESYVEETDLTFTVLHVRENGATERRAVLVGVDSYGDIVPTSVDASRMDEGEIVETFSDGSTKTTTIEYDADGNPVKITDGDGNVTVLTW